MDNSTAKVSEVYCEAMQANNVMECVSSGLELGSYVISKASCVVSLGPEPKVEEEKPADAGEEEGVEGDSSAEEVAGAESLKEAGVEVEESEVEREAEAEAGAEELEA